MRKQFLLVAFILFFFSSCYTGTKTQLLPEDRPIINMDGNKDFESKLKISSNAQVFALSNLDAPEGFKTLNVKNSDWSFFLVRFNLQTLPLSREEVKSTYFVAKFNTKNSSENSPAKVVIDQLFPSSTSRQIYGFETDIKVGGELKASVEGGYGWSLTGKNEEKKSEKKEQGQKDNLTEKLIIREQETTTVKEEIPDKDGNHAPQIKTTTTDKSKVSETEKYDKKSLDASLLKTLQKITDINLKATAAGKAYFEATAKFTASYKKEKWEPLITSVGTLSQQAIWLDRQPFQNGDKYYSVILKVRKPIKNLVEYLNKENVKSRMGEIKNWINEDKLQINRYKIFLRSVGKNYINGVFSNNELKVIKDIESEIKALEKDVGQLQTKKEDKPEHIEKRIKGYIHDHLKLLYKYQSFAEMYEQTLKKKLGLKKENALTEAQKFAVSYQLKELEWIRKDLHILIAKRELSLLQITVRAEAHVRINGGAIRGKSVEINLSEIERLISLVIN